MVPDWLGLAGSWGFGCFTLIFQVPGNSAIVTLSRDGE